MELIEADGKSLSKKTATVKSVTSTRLSDFLDYSNKSAEHSTASGEISTNAGDSTFNHSSMINLSRAVFESDETVGEAPALVVGRKSTADPMKNLQAIIESYRVFREEVSSAGDIQIGDQFRRLRPMSELKMLKVNSQRSLLIFAASAVVDQTLALTRAFGSTVNLHDIKQNKKKSQMELIEADGKSLSKKTATVKSVTSTRLSDFLDYSNKSAEHSTASGEISTNAGDSTFNHSSMINLSRAVFESDETVGEAPALVVGRKSTADPMKNLQAIIESYRVFREETFCWIGAEGQYWIGLKNPAWKYLRSKISQTLTKGKLRQMFPLMTDTALPMMDHLDKLSRGKNGSAKVDVQELNYKYTTDLIASVALGTRLNCFEFPNTEFAKAAGDFFHSFKRMVALVTVFFMPELVEKIGSSMLFNSQFVKKIFWDAVDSREKSGTHRGDFIDSLVNLKNGKQNPIYTTFTLMELARQKECQNKAREDIMNAISKHGWTYEAFNDMKYLDKCVAEGVRLHPSVSTIDRYTRKDYQIPGTDVIIEKGTPIYISLYGLQQDRKYFEEPELFKPERHHENQKLSDGYIPSVIQKKIE
ncbi:hypothetical protein HA402_005840 [Bradysia odoriphaga]|nr:hypothetical protein HA402_005840 [Bradysia odoriphaga]